MKFVKQRSESFDQNTTKATGIGISTSTVEAMCFPVVKK